MTDATRVLRAAAAGIIGAALCVGCASRHPAPVVERGAKPSPEIFVRDERPEHYVVKKGDTLYSIALENGVDWRDVATWNHLSDPSRIYAGQVLKVKPTPPPAGEQAVRVNPIVVSPIIETKPLGQAAGSTSGSTAGNSDKIKTEPKALKLPYSEQNLALMQRGHDGARVPMETPPPPPPKVEVPKAEERPREGGAVEDPQSPDESLEWAWPAQGEVLGRFGESGGKGVDIGGRPGDAVFASAAGKVTYTGSGVRGYGNLVIIKHNDKYLSAYAHNRNILVQQGQSVQKGQKIAELGATGADRAKLHFEIRRFGKPVDPLQFLAERGR